MGLKDVIKQAHGQVLTADLADEHPDKLHPQYVLPRHLEWMQRPESERVWSPEALQFADDVLHGRYKHPRPGRISPSSLGDACERLLLLSYGGYPQAPFPLANQEKMNAGEFHHLRWQMEGLSAPWLNAGELWLHCEAMKCGGSADGRCSDDSLWELKSTAEHLYKAIVHKKGSAVNYGAHMHAKHLLQMETYWAVDEAGAAERGEERLLTDWGSLLYMNAGNPNDLHEIRVHSNPSRRIQVHRVLESLHDWIDINELPDMLESCWKVSGLAYEQTGKYPVVTQQDQDIFNRCQYRDVCASAMAVVVEETQQ